MTNNMHVLLPHTNESKTVLVLGAGASNHLNLPLGNKLCEQIVNNTNHQTKTHAYKQFLEMGYSETEIKEFHSALKEGFFETIDEFLETRQGFLVIGRQAIAQVLMSLECNETILGKNNNWYSLLRKKVVDDIKKTISPCQ